MLAVVLCMFVCVGMCVQCVEGTRSSVTVVDFIFTAGRLAGRPVSAFVLIVLAEAPEPWGSQ